MSLVDFLELFFNVFFPCILFCLIFHYLFRLMPSGKAEFLLPLSSDSSVKLIISAILFSSSKRHFYPTSCS